jgi:hypothetical protein
MNETIISFAFGLASTVIGHAATVHFEPGPSPPLVGRIIPQWLEAGFLFSTPNGLSHYNSGLINPRGPDDGTAYISFLSGPSQSPLTIASTTGDLFTAFSIDLAEYSTFVSAPKAVSFVGTKSDSSTVLVTFLTDGIIDGAGKVDDFQRFFFPSTFTGLISLRVNTDLYAMDNFEVAIVPEPSTCVLFAVAIVSGVFCARRKGQHADA